MGNMENSSSDLEQVLEYRAALIDNRLISLVYVIEPSTLADIIQYALGQRGKRIRSTLLTLSCEAVGGDIDKAIIPAMVVEMIHGTSLILDDMIDNSGTRRGKKTVNARWGDNMALIACDAMMSLAIRELTGTEMGLTRAMLKPVADTMLRMAEGEAMELEMQVHSVEEYGRIAEKKTASLFSLAAECGALAGNGDETQREALRQYGNHLGLAFQIRDDILDFIAIAGVTGKPELRDLAMGRPTLVTVIATNDGLSREKMLSMDRDMLLEALGPHIKKAGMIAEKESEEALHSLDVIPDSLARQRLKALCDYAVARTK
jgi:geranylgeranyl diphosphate synthase type I